MKILAAVSAWVMIFASSATGAQATSPYAGQQTRDIKALAPEDIDGYMSGKGMGLAKTAELNGYPGPAHVLEYASELRLTPDQEVRTKALFGRMQSQASSIGRALVEQERELDRQFASKGVTDASLSVALKRIGALQARVREVHLRAHLDQVAILTPAQVARYAELRGYAGTEDAHPGHAHMH